LTTSNQAFSELTRNLAWNAEGLIPAIIQDNRSQRVLMMAWMSSLALWRTLETGQTHFHSRSRGGIWHKGETSGHVQHVRSIHVDCDGDVLLIRVEQVGAACHEGFPTCFFRRVTDSLELETVESPAFDPQQVYPAAKTAESGS